MKRDLQCAEQQVSPSNLTKYCACHAKWPPKIWQKFVENSCNIICNARPIRLWSENEPVSPPPAAQPRLVFALAARISWNMQHFALRLSFQISPSIAPATKSGAWASPSAAPATKSDTCASISTAPARKSDTEPAPSTTPAAKSHTIPVTWRFLLLDESSYWTNPITWRLLLYLTFPIAWRLLLFDDSYYLTIPITWRSLLFDDPYYLIIPITWLFITWRTLLFDDSYYLTIPST